MSGHIKISKISPMSEINPIITKSGNSNFNKTLFICLYFDSLMMLWFTDDGTGDDGGDGTGGVTVNVVCLDDLHARSQKSITNGLINWLEKNYYIGYGLYKSPHSREYNENCIVNSMKYPFHWWKACQVPNEIFGLGPAWCLKFDGTNLLVNSSH